MQRTIWLAALGLTAIGGDRLSTDYKREEARHVESEFTLEMEVTSMEMTRDGEPVEMPGGGMSSSSKRHVEHVDRVLAHDDSGPTRVRREFTDLSVERSMSFGDQTSEESEDGALDGVTLELTRGDDGEVTAEVVDGNEPDSDASLEGHRLELALDALLPKDEVGAGDEWDLDQDAVLRALALDVQKAMFPEKPPEETPSEGGQRGGRRGRGGPRGASLLTLAEWSGTASYTGETTEFDGATCAVIALEIAGKGDVPTMGPGGGGGGRAFGLEPIAIDDNTFAIEIEGKLLFDRARNLPVHLELEGSFEMTTHSESQWGESQIVRHSEWSGEFSVETTVTVETDEDKDE